MWDNILLILIVAACAFFIVRRIVRQLSGKRQGCGCSCSGCDDKSSADGPCKTTADSPGKNDG